MKYDLSGGVSRSAGRVLSAFRGALFQLLQRQSFESITVQALCNTANYPRSTFYNYFDDIYDLLDYCLQSPIADFSCEKYAAVRKEDRVRAIASDFYDLLEQQRDAFNRVFQFNKPDGVLQSALNRRLKHEVFHTLIDAMPVWENEVIPREMLAEHCCNVIHLVFFWSIFSDKPVGKETAMQYARILLHGLLHPKPAESGAL